MSMNERLDLVIFGATGFTGKYTVKEAARLAKERNFTWGIAGRRKEALAQVLKDFAPDFGSIRTIIADVNSEDSLEKMTAQAKVLVNCCGPYSSYGEPVIKACLKTRTHHVDVSGEPQYMEAMQLKYHKAASDAGIYVVSACGFDSIPCDLGVLYTQEQFKGEVNSIEAYLKLSTSADLKGALLHYATWESAVHLMANYNELRKIRTQLFAKDLPTPKPRLRNKFPLTRSQISRGWVAMFPGVDRSVCRRTQIFLYENFNKRPVQIQTYITFTSLWHVILMAIFGGIFLLLSKFSAGQRLLLNHPKFFSAGVISHEGPTAETCENTTFSITLHAKGWKDGSSEPTSSRKDPFDKEMITRVTGKNPGYGATCTALLISGLTILNEPYKMPKNGGVYSPGAAFGKTSLIDELCKNGFYFETLSYVEK